MGQWIDDNKSVYIYADLAYNLICYNKLCVIKVDEFRKNVRILNNQSIRREREIILIIMEVFARESMARQYKIDGLPYDVNLCFIVHKLIVEVDKDVYVYYHEEQHQIRQTLIENLGFTFIRINADVENFDPDLCKRIIELHVKFF